MLKIQTTPPEMSLEDATSKMIGILAKKSFTFSAHDVTKLLREAVNRDAVLLAGLPPSLLIQIGDISKMTTEIDHLEVKNLVHNAYRAGELPGYNRVQETSQRTGSAFWEYKPNAGSLPPPSNLTALA